MGLGLNKQQNFYSSFSTGLIKIGSDNDDPTTILTVNNNISAVGTIISATEVNFQITNHGIFDTAIGKYIKSTGYIPTAYNITGTILNIPDANNIRVTSLSDPITDDTTTGVLDFGSFNIELPGVYRIVDRVDDLNQPPANNQFSKSRSKMFAWTATSNIDHTAVGLDGNFIILVDNTSTISIVQLPSGRARLSSFEFLATPNFNTHVSLGSLTKDGGDVVLSQTVTETNNNPINRIKNIADIINVINNTHTPITVSPIAGTIGIAQNLGVAFIGTQGGYEESNGLNPNQTLSIVSSPSTIFTVDRAGNGNITNISTVLNINEFESSPGVFTSKGASKASNNFIIGFGNFNVELLGQTTYSGGTRLVDASVAGEEIDNPGISILGIITSQISIENAATDLTNSSQAIFKDDLKQFS